MTEHDDSFPSLMPKPGAPLLPVQIGPTSRRAGEPASRRRHLTGMVALNIPDRWDGHGDWHMSATWFWTEPETLKPHSFTDKETYGELIGPTRHHLRRPRRPSRLAGTGAPGRRCQRAGMGRDLRPGGHRDGVGAPAEGAKGGNTGTSRVARPS